jgi:diguanylate cyclase (GGDEF)-like protein
MTTTGTRKIEERLLALTAAFDVIPSGVVVLDAQLRTQFINTTFFYLWELAKEQVSPGDPFEKLMRITANRRSPLLTEAELNEYIRRRIELVRDGAESPRTVRLSNGKTLRIACKPLPDGGRALVYTDVSDLIDYAEKLHELATIDELTGLFNRRYLMNLIESENGRFERYRRPTSLMMVDIDEFKNINDQSGHAVGDKVLRGIAKLILDIKRRADIAARIGGDEFLILLPETSQENALVLAERLRAQVENHLVWDNVPLKVTISIGVAEAKDELSMLIQRVDDALYAAKRAGRNQAQAYHGARHSS